MRKLFYAFIPIFAMIFSVLNFATTVSAASAINLQVTDDATITFTNAKSGSIPTGIISNIYPSILLMIIAFAVIAFIIYQRRKDQLNNSNIFKSFIVLFLIMGIGTSNLEQVNALTSNANNTQNLQNVDLSETSIASPNLVSTSSQTAHTPVSGTTVTIHQYVVMKQDARVPNSTFHYVMSSGTEVRASDNNGVAIFAGYGSSKTTGYPTITNASFTPNDTTYTTVQLQPTGTNQQIPSGKLDPVTLSADEKYARKDVTIDFTSVTFKQPGIYRYMVIYTTTQGGIGFIDDPVATRCLDVYVETDTNGVLSIAGYVLHKTEAAQDDDKGDGFVTQYLTHNITIENEISGNQASKDKYFKFDFFIGNPESGVVFDVDLTDADATTSVTPWDSTQHTNPSSITMGSQRYVSVSYWLQGGQSIVIKGVPDTSYIIFDEIPDYSSEGYTTTYTIH